MTSQQIPAPTTTTPPAEQTPIPEPQARPVPPLFSGRPTLSGPPEPTQASDDPGAPFGGSGGPSERPSGEPERGSAPSGNPFSRKEIRDTIRVVLESGSDAAHEALCRDEVDREYERWLAEERELDGLADPLAGMASRRMSAAGVAASPDAADAIAAAVAVLAYLLRQVRLWRAARSQRALLAAGHVRDVEDEAPLAQGFP